MDSWLFLKRPNVVRGLRKALQTAERSEGCLEWRGLIAILPHSAFAPFGPIAVSLMESSPCSDPITGFAMLRRVGNADRCRIFPSSRSSSLTSIKNSVIKGYGPHNQGFRWHLTSLLFISEMLRFLSFSSTGRKKKPRVHDRGLYGRGLVPGGSAQNRR